MSPDTRTNDSRFLSLPSTRAGRITAILFVIALVLVVLNTALVLPYTESRTGLDTFQQVYNLVAGLVVVAMGVAGIVAIAKERERSLAVVVPVLVALVVLAMMISDFLD